MPKTREINQRAGSSRPARSAPLIDADLFVGDVRALIESASAHTATTVNSALVVVYYMDERQASCPSCRRHSGSEN
jgi:hypothetical protein